MPFVTFDTRDGPVTAIVCGRGLAVRPCAFCGRISTKLCDFPTGKKKTCDAALCDKCATSVGPNQDYCPAHKLQAPPPQKSLFEGGA